MNLFKSMEKKFYQVMEKFVPIKLSPKEKFYFLNFMRAISLAGQNEKESIYSKYEEYVTRGYIPGIVIMEKVIKYIKQGKSVVDSLKFAGVLTDSEYHILKNSKDGLANGIERILEANKKSFKAKLGFIMLAGPPGAMLVVLLATRQILNDALNKIMEPIKMAGAEPPPLPGYMQTDTVYLVGNVAFFSIIAVIFGFAWYVKKYKPKKYLSLLPIIEEEYTYDIIKSIRSVIKGGGLNLTNAAKALYLGEKDNIKKLLYKEIYESARHGKVKLHEILKEFSVNYNTVSAIKIGEDAKDLELGINIALDDIQKRYERDIKIFLKGTFFGGQIGMMGVAMKPMIDVMLLISVGQLNFQIN